MNCIINAMKKSLLTAEIRRHHFEYARNPKARGALRQRTSRAFSNEGFRVLIEKQLASSRLATVKSNSLATCMTLFACLYFIYLKFSHKVKV